VDIVSSVKGPPSNDNERCQYHHDNGAYFRNVFLVAQEPGLGRLVEFGADERDAESISSVFNYFVESSFASYEISKAGLEFYSKIRAGSPQFPFYVIEASDVVIDGLYSWEEYIFLKDYYRENLYLVAVWASPQARYSRLSRRSNRGLTVEEAASRDRAEIENINKGGPIAMADFTIINEASLENLKKETKRVISILR
jgi:hypothetical protein